MTEAESEVELGAAEEESNTEAAPQGPGISTKSTSTPRAAPNGIITDKALLTRIRETSQPIVVETIISKRHSVTVPIATVIPVVIVDDQIIFQTNAKHASIANASDISAVIARRPEPIR